MILLDTNIFSALMQKQPDGKVMEWLDRMDAELLWTTVISVYEIRNGIGLMASGKKQRQLAEAFETLLRQDFRHRVIELEINAALAAGELAASSKRAGCNIGSRDLLIAGIAVHHGATLATRNVKDFEHARIPLINPYAVG